jgi:hypothetical protein
MLNTMENHPARRDGAFASVSDRTVVRARIVRRAAVAACIAALAPIAPAWAAPPGTVPRAGADARVDVTTLLTFDQTLGENPENLALDRAGNVYVTLLLAHTVVRLDECGRVARVVLPGAVTAGIAIDPLHPDRLTVAVSSPDAALAGLWTVPLAAFSGLATPSRTVALPPESFPNGITYDGDGTLYVADSNLARIWRVSRDSHTAAIWLSAQALAPTGATDAGLVLPGANGVKIARGRIWVSNTSTSTLLSAPIARDGSPGELSVMFDHLFEIDDFQITRRGEIIAALNGASQVVSISPNGRIRILEDAAAGARNPSAVALSGDDGIYVTNAAFLTVGATLQLITEAARAGR